MTPAYAQFLQDTEGMEPFSAEWFRVLAEYSTRYIDYDSLEEDLQDLIDGFADDDEVVKLTGDQTVAGNKTFSDSIVMNGDLKLLDPVNDTYLTVDCYPDSIPSNKTFQISLENNPNSTATLNLTGLFSTLSGTNTGDQNLFSTIAVSGQSNIVADTNADTLTLVAGSNVTITTNAIADEITISASVPVNGSGTNDAITYWVDSDTLGALSTATYPSLTELSYVKGVTSSIQTQLGGKEPTITAGTTSQYWRGDKSWQTLDKSAVGLGNVDNTSDLNKPISTATQTALDGKVDENTAITGATKTKITYDSKGLVTSGADATTADIADSTNKRYVTDSDLTKLSNLSGTNTGDQNLFSTIAVSGQSDVVADSTSDTLTLVAGSNVTITTNATNDEITIASTGGGGGGDVFLANNNAFTGANTFTNTTGQIFRQAATQDGILLRGRAGGTLSYRVEIVPSTLSANRILTLANGDTTLVAGTMVATASSNTFTGANTFTNSTGQTFRTATNRDSIRLVGGSGGTSNFIISVVTSTLSASRTLTLPNVTGTVITSGDTGTVTNTMLANNSVTVNGTSISLGSSGTITAVNPNALTIGTGLSGTSYNGSSAVTIAVNSTLDSNARVGVEKNGTLVGTRRNINFIEGSGVSITVTDDSVNEEVDVTIASTGAVSGSGTAGRLALWDGTSSLTSDSALTYDSTNDDLTVDVAKIGGVSGYAVFANSSNFDGNSFALMQTPDETVLNAATGDAVRIRRNNSSTYEWTYDGSYLTNLYDTNNWFSVRSRTTGGAQFSAWGSSTLFTFDADVTVPDEAYGSGWNGSLEVPTKNSIYDAIGDITSAGRALLDDADASAQRTTLGLGSIATQASSSVSITGGTITGITDLAIADGGTNSSTQTTNGITYYNGTGIVSGSKLTWNGTTLEAESTGTQLKLDYDSSNYATLAVNSNGDLTVSATGSGIFPPTVSVGNALSVTGNITGSNLSGTNTGDQNLFSTIAVSGQSNVVADSTSDTLTLAAGSNVTITTDASTDTITIAATGGGGGSIDGSGAANKLAIWSDADTLTSDTNLHWDTTNDRLGLGTATPQANLQIVDSLSTLASGLMVYKHGNDTVHGRITLRKSRGTEATPTAVANQDYVGQLGFGAYTGTQWLDSIARVWSQVNGTVTTSSVPVDLMFYTGTTTGGVERMRIYSGGNIGIGTSSITNARLNILSTTEQLRVLYNSTNYYTTTVGSTGGVTFDSVGTGSSFTFSDNVGVGATATNTRLNSDVVVYQDGVTRKGIRSYSFVNGNATVNYGAEIIAEMAPNNTAGQYCQTYGLSVTANERTSAVNDQSTIYGIYSKVTGSGTTTTKFGLYVDALNGATAYSTSQINYAILASGGLNVLHREGEQLRVAYNSTNYLSFNCSSAGSTSIASAGTTRGITLESSGGRLGFYGATPISRPTTGSASATFTANTGTAVNDASTFDGYTIGQIVKALRDLGVLA